MPKKIIGNRNKRIIDIVYKTISENQNKFGVDLNRYDNWKDDIIEKIQNYIQNNYQRIR